MDLEAMCMLAQQTSSGGGGEDQKAIDGTREENTGMDDIAAAVTAATHGSGTWRHTTAHCAQSGCRR
jgi:hypothetical protein